MTDAAAEAAIVLCTALRDHDIDPTVVASGADCSDGAATFIAWADAHRPPVLRLVDVEQTRYWRIPIEALPETDEAELEAAARAALAGDDGHARHLIDNSTHITVAPNQHPEPGGSE